MQKITTLGLFLILIFSSFWLFAQDKSSYTKRVPNCENCKVSTLDSDLFTN